MSVLEKFSLEYDFRTSPRLLYTAISTPEGLSRWFADVVIVEDDVFVFRWEGSEQRARLVECKENEYVKFLWLDDFHHDHCLEMKIDVEPVSSLVALIITDFAEPVDIDFSQRIWESQVRKLQRLFNP